MKFATIIEADNFNEMYRHVLNELVTKGDIISPRGMKSYEITNMNLVLTKPRRRLLDSQVRKHSYTYASAEFLWYMVGTNRLDYIAHYLPRMADYSDDGETLNSAYGYRIFGMHKDFPNQWLNVISLFNTDRDSRQGVITVNYQKDLDVPSKDVPCTLNLHFLIRENKLNLMVQMRSNDAYMGLIYDVFAFTLMLEKMLEDLKCYKQFRDLELGTYVHKSGSMHLYDRNINGAYEVIQEDYDSSIVQQDEMLLDRYQLEQLKTDEVFLRGHDVPIKTNGYTGICRFMAEKLNRSLEKK